MKSLLTWCLALAVSTGPLDLSAASNTKSKSQHNIIERVLLISLTACTL